MTNEAGVYMLKPLTYIVTGVAGFIGSHLADRLIKAGHYVIGIDCFTDYYPQWMKENNLKYILGHDRFTFIQADLLEMNLIRLFQGQMYLDKVLPIPIDSVFHLAAHPGVRASWGSHFDVYVRNNILATQKLLEAAKEIPLKKFIYASSSSVYGNIQAFPTSEYVTPNPISPYGVTKLAGEHLCLLYWRSYGLPVVCLRYFTTYGPRQRPDMAFHAFIQAMLEKREIVIYGDGEQTRDFTYVGDVVEGTVQAVTSNLIGEIVNIGSGTEVTVNNIIEMMEGIIDCRAQVRHIENQRGDVRHTYSDISKANLLLDYKLITELREGLTRQITWQREFYREKH
jgi:nucleoside-diphosphate-sugar epimerase